MRLCTQAHRVKAMRNTAQNSREQWNGALWQNEIDLAKTVFQDTLPYERIFIGNVNMGTGAVTVASSPVRSRANFIILWDALYAGNANNSPDYKNTFIHELTHV